MVVVGGLDAVTDRGLACRQTWLALSAMKKFVGFVHIVVLLPIWHSPESEIKVGFTYHISASEKQRATSFVSLVSSTPSTGMEILHSSNAMFAETVAEGPLLFTVRFVADLGEIFILRLAWTDEVRYISVIW